jgi:hypothetical protein
VCSPSRGEGRAVERGIAMPNFFGFMAWSAVILVPIFVLVSWLFFA